MERRRKELKVEELSFNSFYEYSVQRIPDICHENHISGIDLSTYRYMMKDFYRGGNHEKDPEREHGQFAVRRDLRGVRD